MSRRTIFGCAPFKTNNTRQFDQTPVVRKLDNFIHQISLCPAQTTFFNSVWFFWRDFCIVQCSTHFYLHFWKRFIWLYHVFPSHFIYWIAAYPVDNAIRPLNNWGQTDNPSCACLYTRHTRRTTRGITRLTTLTCLSKFVHTDYASLI